MPSRLIREGILTSDRVNRLSADAEVFYRRLMSRVDDFGLFDARPAILRASLYPLRLMQTTENICLQLLAECQEAGLVNVFEKDGKHYLQMLDTKWKIRSEAKYPLPGNGVKEVNCKQLLTTVPLVVDVVEVVGVVNSLASSLRSDASALTADTQINPLKDQTPSKATRSHPRGTRFDLSELPESWRAFCLTERPHLEPGVVFERFKDHWLAQAGERARKVDWLATWRNWVRNEKKSNGELHPTPAAPIKDLCRWPDCPNDSRWEWDGLPYCEQHYVMSKRGEKPTDTTDLEPF